LRSNVAKCDGVQRVTLLGEKTLAKSCAPVPRKSNQTRLELPESEAPETQKRTQCQIKVDTLKAAKYH